jgi:hypothetical protein
VDAPSAHPLLQSEKTGVFIKLDIPYLNALEASLEVFFERLIAAILAIFRCSVGLT